MNEYKQCLTCQNGEYEDRNNVFCHFYCKTKKHSDVCVNFLIEVNLVMDDIKEILRLVADKKLIGIDLSNKANAILDAIK